MKVRESFLTASSTFVSTKEINIENKPHRRLCKMYNPFFNEFLFILSANVFQLVSYTATMLTTEAVD
jgi:hypothetical protein